MKKVFLFLFLTSLLAAQTNNRGEQDLFFMPTANTLPSGTAYFADYEVFFINFTVAPGNTTMLGLTTLFPITYRFLETATITVKQKVYGTDYFGAALFGGMILKPGVYFAAAVLSAGDSVKNIHAGIGTAGTLESHGDKEVLILLGAKYKVSQKVALIGEFTSTGDAISSDYPGLLSIGLRLGSESSYFDIAAVRPLGDDNKEAWFLIPFIKAVIYF